ncbi:hypothetical protein C0995_005181 [Termitomyces sp. Mi166|nr:hypothetical protein C0995_005181 [Termitomyces sp. Mi166\
MIEHEYRQLRATRQFPWEPVDSFELDVMRSKFLGYRDRFRFGLKVPARSPTAYEIIDLVPKQSPHAFSFECFAAVNAQQEILDQSGAQMMVPNRLLQGLPMFQTYIDPISWKTLKKPSESWMENCMI